MNLCPRRSESALSLNFPGPDTWPTHDGVRSCSYCGSMHPDDLFMAISGGSVLTPTDKNYKLYVELPNPDAGKRVVIGSESGPAFDQVTGEPRKPDLTVIERMTRRYNRQIWGEGSPTMTKKFYFQHLSVEERERFINLLNAQALKLAEPGYFYVLPFFATYGNPGEV